MGLNWFQNLKERLSGTLGASVVVGQTPSGDPKELALNPDGVLITEINKAGTAVSTLESTLTDSATILEANPSRKKFILQNVGTVAIHILLGEDDVTATNCSFTLQAGSAPDDGRGGAFVDDVYTGAVKAIGSGAGAKIRIVEM